MPGDYAVLASVYDDLNMGDSSRQLVARLIDYIQRNDWLGRFVVVLGCGTGASLEYLSQFRYTITGVDQSTEMLDIARRKLEHSSVKWVLSDIRELGNQVATADLMLALNVINDLNSLRDIEMVFASVSRILEPGKLFLFDLTTLQGLTEEGSAAPQMLADPAQSVVGFVTHDYDYERQLHTANYTVFRKRINSWERLDAKHLLRSFPVQAVATLVQRSGLTVKAITTANLEPYDPVNSRASRVVFITEKPSA